MEIRMMTHDVIDVKTHDSQGGKKLKIKYLLINKNFNSI